MRRSRSLLLFLLLLTAVLAGTAFFLGAGIVGFWEAVRALAFMSVFATAVCLALLVRRTNQQLRQLRTGLDSQVRHIREITGENRVELVGRTEEIADRLAAMEGTLRSEAEGRAGGRTDDHAEGDPKVLT